jgi:hypothetical protein
MFDDKTFVNARFLHLDESIDIAILEINEPQLTQQWPVMQVSSTFDLKRGDTVYCQGASGTDDDPYWSIEDGIVNQVGSVNGKVPDSSKVGAFSTTGDIADGGDSGAPVWDRRGVVYGVHVAGFTGDDDPGVHIRIDAVRNFYRSKMGRDIPAPVIGQVQSGGTTPGVPGLPPTSPSPTPTPTPGTPAPAPIPRFSGQGVPIAIAIGEYGAGKATYFTFAYTGINVKLGALPEVTITGKSVKWNTADAEVERQATGKTYQGASLFDIAAAVTASAGVPLTIEGDGSDVEIPYAVQSQGGRQFLAALAAQNGYRLREYNGTAILSPQAAARDSKFIITYGMTEELTFSDAADTQRVLLRDSFATIGSKTAKPTIDLATGRIEYPKTLEQVIPAATTVPNGTNIGRGYPAEVPLLMSEQSLLRRPGELVWIDYSLAPNPFARDWRVERVKHSISGGGVAKTELSLYLPVYIQQQQTTPSPSPSPGVTPSPSPVPGITPTPSPAPAPGTPSGQKLTPQQIFDLYADAVIHISSSQGIGTGFIVSREGHFLTCNHVLNSTSGRLTFRDGTAAGTYTIVGTDANRDMTVGKLANYPATATTGGKGKICWCAMSHTASPNGSVVTAIGHPLDKRWTLTSSPRTGTSKCLSYRGNTTIDCIQTGPRLVDRGNSGGPGFNEFGLVTCMAESQTDNADGLTQIDFLRTYYQQVVGSAIPDPAAAQPTPTPSPVPAPQPPPQPVPPTVQVPAQPPASNPPQPSITSEAQLENLTSLRMINPEPGTRTTSAFGWRNHPVAGGRRLHRGTDCAKGKGTKILAAAGKVIKIGGVSGYGDYNVVVYHGKVNGVAIHGMYAHGSNLRVSVGQFVAQGDWIVSEDTLGMSTGSHLHFGATIGYGWPGAAYPANSPNVWYDPVKNFITSTFTGAINSDGVLDNGTRGGNMPI